MQMTRPTTHSDTGDGNDGGSDRGSIYRTPRWVKVFGIALLILMLLIVIMLASGHLTGGHGPGHHFSGMFGTVVGGEAHPISVAAQLERRP
jgi:hypothetical protein